MTKSGRSDSRDATPESTVPSSPNSICSIWESNSNWGVFNSTSCSNGLAATANTVVAKSTPKLMKTTYTKKLYAVLKNVFIDYIKIINYVQW